MESSDWAMGKVLWRAVRLAAGVEALHFRGLLSWVGVLAAGVEDSVA